LIDCNALGTILILKMLAMFVFKKNYQGQLLVHSALLAISLLTLF